MHERTANTEARIAIEPDFAWDGQDAYLFDIDGTLLRSRDRVHFRLRRRERASGDRI